MREADGAAESKDPYSARAVCVVEHGLHLLREPVARSPFHHPAIKISDLCQRNFHYSESFPSTPNSRKFARS
jgi:hypothetical protein